MEPAPMANEKKNAGRPADGDLRVGNFVSRGCAHAFGGITLHHRSCLFSLTMRDLVLL